MKDFLLEYGQTFTQELTVEHILLNMAVALVLGIVIYISYRFSHAGAIYSAKFNVSLLMMTLVTTMVMNVIGNNISLSLGMVGALSIIRFRTAIKDSRDTAYIFWCIAVGICCGVSYYALAGISTGIIFLVMLILGNVKSNDRYLLCIHGNSEADTRQIEKLVQVQYGGKAILRVFNQTYGHVEYIYEISSKLIAISKKREKDPVEMLTAMNGITRVNLVCQNEDMSR